MRRQLERQQLTAGAAHDLAAAVEAFLAGSLDRAELEAALARFRSAAGEATD